MSLKKDLPMKINVAKAKDLPPSWYELVLRPNKFAEHLEILRQNPDASPNAAHLIVTFLDKAGVFSILSSSSSSPTTSLTDAVTGDKEKKLVRCALLMASSVQWDFSGLLKDLPPSVQFCLLLLLCGQYPSPEVGVVSGEGAPVMAHVLFSEWVLKFLMHDCYSSCAQPRPSINTWDTTCVGTDQIKDLVKLRARESLSYLTDFLQAVQSSGATPVYWESPRVGVDLPVLVGDEVHLEPPKEEEGERTPFGQHLCELEYVIGCFLFTEGEYKAAHGHLMKTQELLAGVQGPSEVDVGKLRGFLLACEGMSGAGGEEEKAERKGRGKKGKHVLSVNALEKCLRVKDYQGVVDILTSDLSEGALPSELLTTLEREVPVAVEGVPRTKRHKLDEPNPPQLSLLDKVTICCALLRVLRGMAPQPRFWGALRSGGTERVRFILKLCEAILKKGVQEERRAYLQNFIRSICGSGSAGVQSWEQLSASTPGKSLVGPQDSAVYQSLRVSEAEVEDDVIMQSSSSYTPVEQLERMIAQVNCPQLSTPQEVMDAVDDIFMAIPPSKHKALATKWMGSSRGFAPVESDYTTVTKYNCLIHRVQLLSKMKCHEKCLELYTAASKLLNSMSHGSSKFRAQLKDYIDEQLLMMELLVQNKGGGAVESAALVSKAKSYYTNRHHWSVVNASNLHIVGAFLLNAREFSFLFQYEIQHTTVAYTVAARLAEAVVDVMEAKDLRRSLRGLFEAVLSVFSPLLHTNEGKAEGSERQSKLRTNLDLFSRNLRNSTALSLLVAALARIWNLLKKPEDEILTEFNGQWPTAIGNAANIDSGHVFRVMSTALNHALQLYPNSTSWIIIKANVHSAVGEHGAALESYMEAAALASDHFHRDIPATVWSRVTLHRLIACCCRLGYHTHAVVLCQLLQPVDYEHAFSILRENVGETVASVFPYLWDMTIIEYLIYIHSKKADSHKQAVAIQVAGQVDLNFNNSSEVLARAAQVRRRKFLRTFYTQITHAI